MSTRCHSGIITVGQDPVSGVSLSGTRVNELAGVKNKLIINLSGSQLYGDIGFNNLSKKSEGKLRKHSPSIISINWQDFGVLPYGYDFWLDLVNVIRIEKKPVIVCCVGGHGRTGTCLAILCGLLEISKNPVSFIRKKYCSFAIETAEQENYVREILLGQKQLK